MKTKEKLELRMYSLVLYNISPIQQGIQAYHATIEATVKNSKLSIDEKQFKDWAKNWKTVIILNGSSSITLKQHFQTLLENKIKCNEFYEPDLGNIMTAISFIVDERVFNKTKYPDFEVYLSWSEKEKSYQYNKWVKSIGGKQNEFLRTFLSKFKLA